MWDRVGQLALVFVVAISSCMSMCTFHFEEEQREEEPKKKKERE